jgi:hypothetical protein
VVEDIAAAGAAANDKQYRSYFRLRVSHWYRFLLASFFCLKIVPLVEVMLLLPLCFELKYRQTRSTTNQWTVDCCCWT